MSILSLSLSLLNSILSLSLSLLNSILSLSLSFILRDGNSIIYLEAGSSLGFSPKIPPKRPQVLNANKAHIANPHTCKYIQRTIQYNLT